ncbi:MAG: CmcI family methyltransferase, partial [Sulfuricurvum sp.]|nr:CmcI family methyltransferase [Sulfuricurvum sp.]
MNPIEQFKRERAELIKSNGENEELKSSGLNFLTKSANVNYSYNFSWLGRPIIQYPQDIVAMQELIWEVKPDLIIETGIAHGGSLIFSASMLALLEICGEIEKGEVLGIDIDIRAHNK